MSPDYSEYPSTDTAPCPRCMMPRTDGGRRAHTCRPVTSVVAADPGPPIPQQDELPKFSATELAEAMQFASIVIRLAQSTPQDAKCNDTVMKLQSAARFIAASAEGWNKIAEMAPSVEAERMGNGPYLGCAMLEIATKILTTYLRL